jgi:hypothetical protein
MKKIVVLSIIAAGMAWTSGFAQGPMRGEADLQATQKSLEMGLLVEEIEEAGFVLDVTEGFDEEWEEATWLGTEGDDIEVTDIREEDADLFAIDSEVEGWIEEDSEELATVSDEAEFASEDVAMDEEAAEIALEEDEAADLYESEDEEVDEDAAWWNEGDADGSWDELGEEWELEALENSYEEEDMEVLEALYERG